jgi:hypothetical protein
MRRVILSITGSVVLVLASLGVTIAAEADPLPSWNDGAAKERILAFVSSVADPASPDFRPVEERIAVLDVDGTLWVERPYYLDALFPAARVAELAAAHPEWADQLPFAPIVGGDFDVLNGIAGVDVMRLMAASYDGASDAEWDEVVDGWLATTPNEALGRVHASDTYLPMIELLDLLRANEFTPYLVTAAEEQFMRAAADDLFGVPPEQVIGVEIAMEVTEGEDGSITLTRGSTVDRTNEREGKVLNVYDVVGRKPLFAAGNSDGDYHMLKWTTSGEDPGLAVLVLHDDAEREFDYERVPTLGGEALESDPGWVGVSMQDDWATVFSE